MIVMDAQNPSPAQIRLRELARQATQSGFALSRSLSVDSAVSTVGVERRVGEYVDRMILNTRVGVPSMIFRYQWNSDYPWIKGPQPEPVAYEQGEIADVLETAVKWSQS
jgi:hypothetical protein